jgi:hypothetical protein
VAIIAPRRSNRCRHLRLDLKPLSLPNRAEHQIRTTATNTARLARCCSIAADLSSLVVSSGRSAF